MVHYCHCTWTAFVWIPERNLYCLRFGYRCHPYFYYCCYWWQPFCNREHCEAALVIDSVSSHTDSFRPRSGYHRKARERVFGKRERTTVYSKPKVKIHLSVPFACPSGSAFFERCPTFSSLNSSFSLNGIDQTPICDTAMIARRCPFPAESTSTLWTEVSVMRCRNSSLPTKRIPQRTSELLTYTWHTFCWLGSFSSSIWSLSALILITRSWRALSRP